MSQLEHARRCARHWFVITTVAVIARFAVRAVGLDELDLPLELLSVLAFGMGMNASGWADGYGTRQREGT